MSEDANPVAQLRYVVKRYMHIVAVIAGAIQKILPTTIHHWSGDTFAKKFIKNPIRSPSLCGRKCQAALRI
jgi:hypothetical protein